MKTVIESECDKKLEQNLRSYLRTTGRLVPETPEEVEHLLILMPELTQPKGTTEDAMDVLTKGFIHFTLNESVSIVTLDTRKNFQNMAARNAGKLTDDILLLMESDRINASDHPEEE